jgi:FkbM family methyltransferase
MRTFLKQLVSRLPAEWQWSLKRRWYRRQVVANRFDLEGDEEEVLRRLLAPGDWVLDVGANVGHYAVACSRIVGPSGRVVALEPVPETFALLSHNCLALEARNVTLLNLAASDRSSVRGMSVPRFASGIPRPTEAHLTDTSESDDVHVVTLALDDLSWPTRIALVKIDTEGHELSVLRGLAQLISRDRPHLIVEKSSDAVVAFLADFGYRLSPLSGPSNYVLVHQKAAGTGVAALA